MVGGGFGETVQPQNGIEFALPILFRVFSCCQNLDIIGLFSGTVKEKQEQQRGIIPSFLFCFVFALALHGHEYTRPRQQNPI